MITVIDTSWAYVLQNDLNVSNDAIEIDAIDAIPNHDNFDPQKGNWYNFDPQLWLCCPTLKCL